MYSNAESMRPIQHSINACADGTQVSIEKSRRLTEKSMNALKQRVARGNAHMVRQLTNRNQRLNRTVRTIQSEVKQMNARLGTLTITENEETGDYSIFAGENLHEIMLPLLMMEPGLLKLLSELTRSRKIEVSRGAFEDIDQKLKKIISSCHSASAADLRRQKKADWRSKTNNVKQASDPGATCIRSKQDREYNAQFHLVRSLFSLRSDIRKEKLPHGILQVRRFPLRYGTNAKNKSSNGYFLVFTFMPHSWKVTKCLTISLLSGIKATQSPKEFHYIRSFSILERHNPLREVIMQDDVTGLQKAISAGTITPWDLTYNWIGTRKEPPVSILWVS